MKFRKKIGNLGFSLVELLVTVAIIAIVGGAITSFIVVAQKNYNAGAAETDIQTEAQLVTNQLRELMIDTARGISYSYSSDYMDANAFDLIDDSALPDDYATKSLYIYDSQKYYELIWDTDKKQILYQEYNKDDAPASLSDLDSRKVLANNVSNFSVDLSSIKDDRTVAFTITMQRDAAGRVYTTSHKVKLRNEVLINAPRDDIYDEPDPGDTVPTKIVIGPKRLYAWPGTDAVLSAIVTSDDGGVPSQSVAWTVENASATIGDDKTDVNNNTNVLHLGAAERGSAPEHTFQITAHKVVTTETDTITINSQNTINTYVRVIDDVYGSNDSNGFVSLDEYIGEKPNGSRWSVKTGEECTFQAEIYGSNLYSTGLDGETLIPLTNADMEGVQITVTGGVNYLVTDSLKYDTENGKIEFKVKEATDEVFAGYDWEGGNPTFTLHAQIVKAAYNTVSRDIVYEIRKPEPMSISVSSLGRNGNMQVQLGGAKFADYVVTDSHGKTSLKDGYYRLISYVIVHSDGSKSQTYQISDAGNHGVGMDTNGPLTVKITEGDVYNFSAYLRPNFFSYAGTYYYSYHPGQEWMAAADNSDSITDVDCILLTVTIGDLLGTAEIDVEPVVFNYSVANPYNDTDAQWNSVSQILYVTPEDTVTNHAYNMHFKLTGGWADGTDYAFNDFRPNNSYEAGGFYPENGLARYSGIATKKNSTSSYRYDLGVASDAQGFGKMLIDPATGENDKTESSASKKPTVTFTVPSDKATLQSLADEGVIVKEIYEYNPWFDRKANDQVVSYGANYSRVNGCEGIAEFRFVNKNVFLAANSKSDDPVSWYCPTYDEIRNGFIETNGSRTGYYYYITEVCRYFVSKAGDDYRAIYETYDGKTWNSGLHLKYYGKDADHSVAGWYEFNQNIELKYYQYQTPSTLYLPTYEELSKQGVQRYDRGFFDDFGWKRGYFYTYGVDNERFFVFNVNGTHYARFEYYNDAQGRWLTDDEGDSDKNDLYLLTYDKKDQVWRDSYPDNIDITYTNLHPEPMQLYLPYYNYFYYSGLQAETHTVLEGGSKTGYYYYPQNGQERFFVYYEDRSHADYEVKSGDSWTALYTLDYIDDVWKDREPVNIYITNNANNTNNDILTYTKYCYTYQEARELRASGVNVIGSINNFTYLGQNYQAYTYQVNNTNRMVLIDLGETYFNRYVAVHQSRNGNSNNWTNRCYYYYITDSKGAGWYDRNWSSGVNADSYELIVLRLPTYNELVAQGYSTNNTRRISGTNYTGIIYPVRNMEDNTNNNDEYFLVYRSGPNSYAIYFRGNTYRRYYTWSNTNSRWN